MLEIQNVFDLAKVSEYFSILQSPGAGWHFYLLLESNGETAPKACDGRYIIQ
jgi:hypothetical protein